MCNLQRRIRCVCQSTISLRGVSRRDMEFFYITIDSILPVEGDGDSGGGGTPSTISGRGGTDNSTT